VCLYGIFLCFSTCSDEDELRESFQVESERKKLGPRGRGRDADAFDFELDLDWGGKRGDQLEKRYLRVGVGVRVARGRDITTDQWAIAE
jgi:hypothetical protein